MEGFHFSTEVAVRFAETDAQGVAHNSNYLVWFEVARVAYLAEHAGGYSAIRDQGVESFVLESHVRYLQPAHFDDDLTIHARVGELRGARFRFEYEITRERRGDRRRLDVPRLRRREDAAADPDPAEPRGRDR